MPYTILSAWKTNIKTYIFAVERKSSDGRMKSVAIKLLFLGILGQSYCFFWNNCDRITSCEMCADNSCRWCPRDRKCHMKGSLSTSCSRAENIVDKRQCNTVLSKYRPELSYKMLLLSAAAYDVNDPQECLNNALKDSKFHSISAFTRKCGRKKRDRCSAYVAVSDREKTIAIAFRGSENFSQVWHQGVSVLTKPKVTFLPQLSGKVQAYWRDAYRDLWSCMKSYVTTARENHPQYKIWVTGHSLGGAMASLASTQIVQDDIAPAELVVLYTFGMPRVGNYEYAFDHDKLVKDSWRVVQYGDPIPHFPTPTIGFALAGPYHHGKEAYYKNGAKNQQSDYKECHGRPFNEDILCSFTDDPLNFGIDRHKTYFSIPVGSFCEAGCVARAKRDLDLRPNATFQFFENRCSIYTFSKDVRVHGDLSSERKNGNIAGSVTGCSPPERKKEQESGKDISGYISLMKESNGKGAGRASFLKASLVVSTVLTGTVSVLLVRSTI